MTEAGVQHVMRLFMQHYAATEAAPAPTPAPASPAVPASAAEAASVAARVDAVAQVICDELVLDR